MNLFGCKFCKYIKSEHSKGLEFECSRKNFDSLLWAILTVFQVKDFVIRSFFFFCLSFVVRSALFVVLYSFSILGMQLFGGEFCTLKSLNLTSRTSMENKCRCCTCVEMEFLRNSSFVKDVHCEEERKNFDHLTFALLTVFQVEKSFVLIGKEIVFFRLGFDSRRLERSFVQRNGKDECMGSTLFHRFDDVWKLCFI